MGGGVVGAAAPQIARAVTRKPLAGNDLVSCPVLVLWCSS